MKRTALFILACAALIMSGCTKEKEKGGGVKSTYRIVVNKNTNVTLPDGGQITASFYPKTEDDALSTDLSVTFKADPSLLSKYTGEAELLPEANYSFKNNPVIIEAERRVPLSEEDYCKLILKHTPDIKAKVTYVLPVVIGSIEGNADAAFDPEDILFIIVKSSSLAGNGTEEDPFKIESIDQLKTMPEYSVAGKTTCFHLENDLDFAAVENWNPVNLDSENAFTIDFNGNGRTLKNFKCTDKQGASIFGRVSGKIHDLNIDNAVVTAKDSTVDIAVLAYQFGIDDENVKSVCENVRITNSQVNADFVPNTSQVNQAFIAVYALNATFKNIVLDNTNSMKLYFAKSMSSGAIAGGLVAKASTLDQPSTACSFIQCGNAVDLLGYNQKQIGGIVGTLLCGHISECWNSGKVEGNEDVAGIVGQMGSKKKGSEDPAGPWTVTDCYNSGHIRITGQRGGGICGCPFNSVTFERCYNVGDIEAMCRRDETGKEVDPNDLDARCIGGIAGFVCGGAGIWDFTVANYVTIKNCHVFSALVNADTRKKTDTEKDPRPGCGAIVGYTSLMNTYTDCFRSKDTEVDNSMTYTPHDPFDQENCSPGLPLNTGSITPTEKMPLPYHGKVTDKSLKEVVTAQGWPTDKWDVTGDLPVLKNNPEPAPVPES